MAPDTLERRPPVALKDPSLLRQQCYINGLWQDADSKATIEIKNPATGGRRSRVSGAMGSPAEE